MKNKKGAEMTIGTIIIIILALVVLVVIIYGFSTGWANLWEKIISFGGGKVNVQTVVQSCQLACATSSTYDWCTKTRSVIFNEDKAAEEKTVSWTCNSLQKGKGSEIGLESCSIDCPEEGACTGNPAPLCSDNDNLGESKCKETIGCKWKDDTTSSDITKGTCEKDDAVLCSSFNNKENDCKLTGCTWNAAA